MKAAHVQLATRPRNRSLDVRSAVAKQMNRLFLCIVLLPNPIAAQQPASGYAGDGSVTSAIGETQIENRLHQMTLEEKIHMLFGGEQPGVSQLPGVPRLGIPAMLASDGPRGMTAAEGTAFPSGIGLASSWDPSLFQAVGSVIGQESRAAGRTMVFAPALNIERDPLNGRFFEYLTEDPYLDGQLGASMVHGIQGERVAACTKHFAANNREWNRDWYMSNVDERALEEIYLPGFQGRGEAGRRVGSDDRGQRCQRRIWHAQNHSLLTTTLKDTVGLPTALVLTDYNHARGTKQAALAGLDVSMPWADWNTESFGKPLSRRGDRGRGFP
jgi:beta-glucosidase